MRYGYFRKFRDGLVPTEGPDWDIAVPAREYAMTHAGCHNMILRVYVGASSGRVGPAVVRWQGGTKVLTRNEAAVYLRSCRRSGTVVRA